MRRARNLSWSSAEMPKISPSSTMSSASGGEAWRGCLGYSHRVAGACSALWRRQIVLALSFAVDGLVVEGLLGDVVRKGSFAFLFS
jgi:hypothetical protein